MGGDPSNEDLPWVLGSLQTHPLYQKVPSNLAYGRTPIPKVPEGGTAIVWVGRMCGDKEPVYETICTNKGPRIFESALIMVQ